MKAAEMCLCVFVHLTVKWGFDALLFGVFHYFRPS